MILGQKISVVIPTLNEEKGIQNTIEHVPSFVDEIIVVDGGSTDKTREIAQKCKAKVILQPIRGYGLAFKTGFEHCTGDLIATTDGDGTYPIEMLEKVVQYLTDKKLDFVSCSRFPLEDTSSMRKRNWIGNYLMTCAARVFWLHPFKDILSGMWVFKRTCLEKFKLNSDSWNLSEEIKIEAYTKFGNGFQEFAIPYRERLGETKLVPWKVGLQNIGYMMAMRTGTVRVLQKLFKKTKASPTKVEKSANPPTQKQPTSSV